MFQLQDFESSPDIEKVSFDSIEKDLQERLYILFSEASKQNLGVLLVLEGWVASGKGDLLKCITTRLDPRRVKVISMEEENLTDDKKHFMHEFWSKLPSYGEQLILDGSWYSKLSFQIQSKILKKKQIPNAYKFIKDFEETITNDRYIVLKYFLNISAKEQKRRLKKASDEGKKWMVSDSDWAEHEKYYDYKTLFEDYLSKTSFPTSPWKIVSAKNKFYTKIAVIESVIEVLELRLKVNSSEILKVISANEQAI
jgi:AMP-polyphosphate phosphotransferase